MRLNLTFLLCLTCCAPMTGGSILRAQDQRPENQPQPVSPIGGTPQQAQLNPADGAPPSPRRILSPLPEKLAALLKGPTPLNPDKTIFLDLKKKRLLLHTEVACTDCLLEMFCCLEETKEHESVVWLRGRAFVVHSGLLALEAKPGEPVSFMPEFKPPSGHVIKIFVNWVDDKGKLHRVDAREWMRHSVSRYYSHKLESPPPGVKLPFMELRYDPFNKEILWYGQMKDKERDKLLSLWDNKGYHAAIRQFYTDSQPHPMTAEFVFTGSYEFQPDNGPRKVYAAEGGQLVCVANFPSAVIDVREASSADDGGQSYEAVGDRVPPRGTPVIVELIPSKKAPKAAAAAE